MKNLENIQELKEILNRFLNSSSSVAIMTHTEPDGDGFCSSLALQRLLRNQAIDSDIVIDADNQLERFKSFMEGAKLSILKADIAMIPLLFWIVIAILFWEIEVNCSELHIIVLWLTTISL